jgi:hypothetical protein
MDVIDLPPFWRTMPERPRQRQARATDHPPDTVRRVLRAVTAGASESSALLLGEQGNSVTGDPSRTEPIIGLDARMLKTQVFGNKRIPGFVW